MYACNKFTHTISDADYIEYFICQKLNTNKIRLHTLVKSSIYMRHKHLKKIKRK